MERYYKFKEDCMDCNCPECQYFKSLTYFIIIKDDKFGYGQVKISDTKGRLSMVTYKPDDNPFVEVFPFVISLDDKLFEL